MTEVSFGQEEQFDVVIFDLPDAVQYCHCYALAPLVASCVITYP